MVRKCVYSGVLEPGTSERPSWVIPSTPGDAGAQQCIDSGGSIVEVQTTGPCGSSSATTQQMVGTGTSGQALSEAVLDPVRRVRDSLDHTHFVRALAQVNYSDRLVEIIRSDPQFAARLAEGVGFLSTVCTAVLARRDDDPILNLTYDERLHGWVLEMAEQVRARMTDGELVAALDQAVGQLEAYVGRSFGDVAADLHRHGRTTV
jgi:hypothetical protein